MPVDAMAVGVFGHLGADERIWGRDEDCYTVFHALSAVVGHLSPAVADDRTRGLWAMNDAEGPWLGADPHGRRAQFPVQPADAEPAPLPVEPFTVTATEAVSRFGPPTTPLSSTTAPPSTSTTPFPGDGGSARVPLTP